MAQISIGYLAALVNSARVCDYGHQIRLAVARPSRLGYEDRFFPAAINQKIQSSRSFCTVSVVLVDVVTLHFSMQAST